jgi:hypothetical protein
MSFKITSPEDKLRGALVKLMRARHWWVHITHGGAYSSGLPDLLACHVNYGYRFIEVKNADAYHFTVRQEEEFPKMMAAGVGIYVIALPVGFTDRQLEYEYTSVIVNGGPNWTKYLGHSKRPY